MGEVTAFDPCLLLQASNLLQRLRDQSDSPKEEIQQLHLQHKVTSSKKKVYKTFYRNKEDCDRQLRLCKDRLC